MTSNQIERAARFAGFDNCAAPDCDFMAHPGEKLCYCHSCGFNPPMSFEQYSKLSEKELAQYRRRLKELESEVNP